MTSDHLAVPSHIRTVYVPANGKQALATRKLQIDPNIVGSSLSFHLEHTTDPAHTEASQKPGRPTSVSCAECHFRIAAEPVIKPQVTIIAHKRSQLVIDVQHAEIQMQGRVVCQSQCCELC